MLEYQSNDIIEEKTSYVLELLKQRSNELGIEPNLKNEAFDFIRMRYLNAEAKFFKDIYKKAVTPVHLNCIPNVNEIKSRRTFEDMLKPVYLINRSGETTRVQHIIYNGNSYLYKKGMTLIKLP